MKRLVHLKYFLPAITLTIMMSACLPDPLEVEGIPVIKPEIVLSSQIIPDQSLVITLTKSFGALDASDDSDPEALFNQIAVNDALVIVSGPASVDTLVQLEPGIYGGINIPFQSGEVYNLFVKSESLGEVTASTQVMQSITFEDIEADLYFNGYDDTLAQITYSLVDPVGDNWYMINVQEVEQEDFVENLLNPRAFTRLLQDDTFEGQQYNEQFLVVPRDYKTGDTIAVSLSNINKDYYDFIQLRLDNRFSFVEYLSEPINYPSNVRGGKGFFNLYIPDFRFFILD